MADKVKRKDSFWMFAAGLNAEDRVDWLRVAGKAHQLYNGTAKGLELFDEWSSTASNYMGFTDCEYLYYSFDKYKTFGKRSKRALKELKKRRKNNSMLQKMIDEQLADSDEASSDHEYLVRKQAKPHGIKCLANTLFIPMINMKGNSKAYQSIEHDGRKTFPRGSKVNGLYFPIDGEKNNRICFVEGFATGSAVHQALGWSVVVTFSARNLITVSSRFRQRFPSSDFYICADNDFKAGCDVNTGIECAVTAARKSKGFLLVPKSKDGVQRKQDFADVLVRDGIEWLRKMIQEQL